LGEITKLYRRAKKVAKTVEKLVQRKLSTYYALLRKMYDRIQKQIIDY
jgi:hypothetical protein